VRIAHLLCELWTRLEVIGRTRGGAYELPLTQTYLADAMGLSLVHTNRNLQRLRRDGLITFHDHEVVVLDWQRLQAAAEFDRGYLQLSPEQSICLAT
jgi:CRP-like cAMP-binding protein